ncbi:MAG: DUF4058 family protein [Caldilineaceae bacterium]
MIASPFPGMDPYLEAPEIWHGLHTRLITIWADQLTAQLAPTYIASLETELVIDYIDFGANGGNGEGESGKNAAIPDVTVRKPESAPQRSTRTEAVAAAPLQLYIPMPIERRLARVQVVHRERASVVAVIELLSPINKRPGEGRKKYLKKRAKYLESSVHLVEIDLLRRWKRMPLEGDLPSCDYLIVVSDANRRPTVDVWPIQVRDSLPVISIPLVRPDPPVLLDIGETVQTAYVRGRYDLQIDYSQPPKPPLSPQAAAWAAALIAERQHKQLGD